MEFNPVVVEFNTPQTPMGGWRDRLPKFGTRGTKIMIFIVSTIMILSMVSFAIFTVQSNNAEFSKKHGLDTNLPQTTGISKNPSALPGGDLATGIGGTTGTDAPVITLTAEPATVVQGKSAILRWTVTNNPHRCVASDDWGGNKDTAGGNETTQTCLS